MIDLSLSYFLRFFLSSTIFLFLCWVLGFLRDLSEISRGEGVETEGGSQLFETQKREGS